MCIRDSLLAIPLVLMSSLNPMLISIIKYENDESSDSKSGFVLFVSTIGSVFGVIFTALVLIPNLMNLIKVDQRYSRLKKINQKL